MIYFEQQRSLMTPTPRQSGIIQAASVDGHQTIEALAERFNVTHQTIRRDVNRLANAGLIARFHGGVRLLESTTENIAYRQRQAIAAGEKQRIARAIAARVPNGCSLIMNIGTTIEAVAHELLRHNDLRVITNNLNVAALLSGNPNCEVIVAGGVVRTNDQAIMGEATIGISGIEPDGTLRDYDYREVRVARTIIDQSRQVWLAADHTKFSRAAMVELATLEEIDMVFTDQDPPSALSDLMAQHDVTCVVS